MYRGGQWVLDVDVRKYFDSIDQAKLRELLARRVTDGVVRRLIDKWLKAGVLDNGQLSYPEFGTPQGGVISPCLANVFLHYVLDEWFAAQVQPRLRGPSTLVRFADDFVVILAHKDDAERVLRVLEKRLGKYGLELHPDKTQMIDFRFKPQSDHDDHQEPLATTFNFLGFTHVWVTSEKGRAMVRQLTAKDRVARTLKAIRRVRRSMRTRPLRDQHQRLCRMLKGHYAYFGISGNYERLATLPHQVARIWRKWLSRRSNERSMPRVAFTKILNLFPLPQPRIVHRYAKP
ncbi:reverse transcriptase domain-containing protein [Caballeronia sordidicola]